MPVFTYIDEEGCLRGPFVDVQMHYWYLQDYLKPSLIIFMHKGLFGRRTTLSELIAQNGEANPFDEYGIQETNHHITTPDYPFLAGFPIENYEEQHRLSECDVQMCSKRFHDVEKRFGIKKFYAAFRKFEALEKAKCLHCETNLYGLSIMEHCLGKSHIRKVYDSGKAFSTKDRDLLFKILDNIECAAKKQS